MKNWKRIFLMCSVLLGGTAFFGYWSFNQFNDVFDNLSASNLAIVKISPIHFFDKTNKEGILTTAPSSTSTTTPEGAFKSATSTEADLNLSFIFPKENDEVYIGCTYQLSFQSSMIIHSLEAALIDVGAKEAAEPLVIGSAVENNIESNSQSLDWKVGAVWPGEYYIKVSNINGIDLESHSKVFTISSIPKGVSADEKEKICEG